MTINYPKQRRSNNNRRLHGSKKDRQNGSSSQTALQKTKARVSRKSSADLPSVRLPHFGKEQQYVLVRNGDQPRSVVSSAAQLASLRAYRHDEEQETVWNEKMKSVLQYFYSTSDVSELPATLSAIEPASLSAHCDKVAWNQKLKSVMQDLENTLEAEVTATEPLICFSYVFENGQLKPNAEQIRITQGHYWNNTPNSLYPVPSAPLSSNSVQATSSVPSVCLSYGDNRQLKSAWNGHYWNNTPNNLYTVPSAPLSSDSDQDTYTVPSTHLSYGYNTQAKFPWNARELHEMQGHYWNNTPNIRYTVPSSNSVLEHQTAARLSIAENPNIPASKRNAFKEHYNFPLMYSA